MGYPIGAVRIMIIAFVFNILAIIAVVLRLWSRRINRTPLAFNDWMATVALLITTGSIANDLIVVFGGAAGYHLLEVLTKRPEQFFILLKVMIPGQILWAAANTCMKISILSLYTVLFPGRKFHYICYATMLVTSLYLISVVVEAFVFCTPIRYNWDKLIVGTCNQSGQSTAWIASGATNLVIDIFVVALPMPKLFGLKMTLARRLSLASMFSLGALICIISLLRVISIANWDLNDITYSCVDVLIYSMVEPSLGIVNTCLPTLRPAFLVITGKNPRKNTNATGYSSGKGSNWTRESKGSGLASNRRRLQGDVEDIRMTEFERLDDEYPLTTRVEGGPGNAPVTHGDINVERRWEVDGHHSKTAL